MAAAAAAVMVVVALAVALTVAVAVAVLVVLAVPAALVVCTSAVVVGESGGAAHLRAVGRSADDRRSAELQRARRSRQQRQGGDGLGEGPHGGGGGGGGACSVLHIRTCFDSVPCMHARNPSTRAQ